MFCIKYLLTVLGSHWSLVISHWSLVIGHSRIWVNAIDPRKP